MKNVRSIVSATQKDGGGNWCKGVAEVEEGEERKRSQKSLRSNKRTQKGVSLQKLRIKNQHTYMTTKKHDSQRSRDLGIKHQISKTKEDEERKKYSFSHPERWWREHWCKGVAEVEEGEERKKSQKSLRSGYITPNPNVLQVVEREGKSIGHQISTTKEGEEVTEVAEIWV
jgi:hypothetical protein